MAKGRSTITVLPINRYAPTHFTVGGTANAITLAVPEETLWQSYGDGQMIQWIQNGTNTGATTMNVNGIGTASVVLNTGEALVGGELVNGRPYVAVHDGTNFVLMTPMGMADDGHLFSANGYQKLSNGLIFQWAQTGDGSTGSTGATGSVTFPVTFPNDVFSVLGTGNDTSGATSVRVNTVTTSGFNFQAFTGGTAASFDKLYWFAVGY